MTYPIKNDMLLDDERRTDFLSKNNMPQSRVEKLNRFSLIARNAAFLLEVLMPSGIYDRTKSKPNSGRFKKGCISWRKGKKLPQFNGSGNSNWKGGKTRQKQGYVLIYSPVHPFKDDRKYVLEHRLVVEKEIGRYLQPTEPVHHLGERADNQKHKLMAFVNQATHIRFERGYKIKKSEIVFDGRKR